MGCAESKEDKRSTEIDSYLQGERPKLQAEIKLLLLGAGESGKTTIQKQIKLLYMNGFDDEERRAFRMPIFNNVVICMRSLVKAASEFGYELDHEAKAAASIVTRPDFDAVEEMTSELTKAVSLLWENESIKKAYERQTEFQLYDCAAYVFGNLKRFAKKDYLPSNEDILNVRTKTTGFSETLFSYQNNTFNLVDVGGQRNERKKWLFCFHDVTSVIFVVAMSEYDLKLYEDNTTNRMQESLKLFKEICESKHFVNSTFILLLNKSDLFKAKLPHSPLKDFFPEYKYGDDIEKATTFISELFQSQSTRMVFTHITCATDTNNIKNVFESVRSTVLSNLTKSQSIV